MSIIGWIVLGLLAGLIAKAIRPGGEQVGIILTTLLGVAGALLGGFLATALGLGDPIDEFFDLSTWLAAAIVGSLIILFLWARSASDDWPTLQARGGHCRPDERAPPLFTQAYYLSRAPCRHRRSEGGRAAAGS
jgi:uncharacterized membrane protein YeaQ/YmgE (transglycosylase-associated protein family)